ncbi:MAG: FecR domain-containing protein [Lachnospiraceae bacterium]|jgi:hypothetical protein|nr:FecR domain-containing protein [Lachnospiraceae bacterium]
MTYTPPEGFALDPQSGRYYRQDGIVNGQQWVTWFDAASGQYEQVGYPAQPQPTPVGAVVNRPTINAAPVTSRQNGVNGRITSAPTKKFAIIAAIALIVLAVGVIAGHFLGFYALPLLTDSVNAVSVLETTGTVDVERPPETIAAREGMRLQERDTVRTASSSSAWLSLDAAKAVGLSELTVLRIDRSNKGFSLTLVEGEIRAQIDKPLADNEDFTVKAGNLALAVRGTVFTANYAGGVVSVHVESGVVAVLDEQGNELAELGPGESGEYEAGEAANVGSQADGVFAGDIETLGNYTGWGVWIYHNFRYEGYFVDGEPNGEGILYQARPSRPDDADPSTTYAREVIIAPPTKYWTI